LGDGLPTHADRLGHLEGWIGPAEARSRALDLGCTQRRAVSGSGAGLGGRPEGDDGSAGDERGPAALARDLERSRDRVGVVTIGGGDAPPGGFEALKLIVGDREAGGPIDRYGIVVPEHD